MKWVLGFLVLVVVWLIYGGLVVSNSWPFDGKQLSEIGQIGDSFGALNTLFSGLAMAGVIAAVFMQSQDLQLQREELKLSRTELERSAKAQERSARLVALAELLKEYNEELNILNKSLANTRSSFEDQAHFGRLQEKALRKKSKIVTELEFYLNNENS